MTLEGFYTYPVGHTNGRQIIRLLGKFTVIPDCMICPIAHSKYVGETDESDRYYCSSIM